MHMAFADYLPYDHMSLMISHGLSNIKNNIFSRGGCALKQQIFVSASQQLCISDAIKQQTSINLLVDVSAN